MRFFEKLISLAKEQKDAPVREIILGWHASIVSFEDGRWGLGMVPPGEKIPLSSREEHTQRLLASTAHDLVSLFASPYPQEFAAASAAAAALLPPEGPSLPLDTIAGIPAGDNVAVMGYDRTLTPFLRDWGWSMVILDDEREAPDVFPEDETPQKLPLCKWCWLSSDTLRNRWFTFIQPYISQMKGVFLRGPGLPWLPHLFKTAGVTHLILPSINKYEISSITSFIAAGGNPWLCRHITWRVHIL
ncbi:Rossmann-like domain-containing protein [Aminobacterium mobile]|uniref:Rossmann-like domain-containing protein n=1 Tax=Aminobacterium mobile TaxID=81467 RepID=UPI0004641245|nr:DUF364 domain-containing protein [Aminobacterium mobile]